MKTLGSMDKETGLVFIQNIYGMILVHYALVDNLTSSYGNQLIIQFMDTMVEIRFRGTANATGHLKATVNNCIIKYIFWMGAIITYQDNAGTDALNTAYSFKNSLL